MHHTVGPGVGSMILGEGGIEHVGPDVLTGDPHSGLQQKVIDLVLIYKAATDAESAGRDARVWQVA